MTRAAANVVRALGIVLTLLVLLAATGILLMLVGYGVFSPRNSTDQLAAVGLGLFYIAILAGGVFLIVKLGKGLAGPAAATDQPVQPLAAITPADRILIDRLLLVLLAEIVLSLLSWILGIHSDALHLWPALLASFLLYQVPYAYLLWRLNKRPDEQALALALALPCLSALWSGYTLLTTWNFYPARGEAVARTTVFAAVDLVIFLLALKLRKQRPLAHPLEVVLITTLALFTYMAFAHFLSPWLFRAFA